MSRPHDIVAFREYTLSNGEKRSDSIRIGVAWPTKGGNFSLKLDHIPVDIANTNIVLMVAAKEVASETAHADEAAPSEAAPIEAAPAQPAAKKAATKKAATKKQKPKGADVADA